MGDGRGPRCYIYIFFLLKERACDLLQWLAEGEQRGGRERRVCQRGHEIELGVFSLLIGPNWSLRMWLPLSLALTVSRFFTHMPVTLYCLAWVSILALWRINGVNSGGILIDVSHFFCFYFSIYMVYYVIFIPPPPFFLSCSCRICVCLSFLLCVRTRDNVYSAHYLSLA